MKKLILFLSGIIILAACDKSNQIDNPYDEIIYDVDLPDLPPNPTSIAGLHQNIFSTKCAIPACHDGSFEPDFRTIESTYATLIYHPVIKNNPTFDFEFRVIPGDTANSWLHERITTDDAVLGRMPLYDTMSQTRVNQITQWILDGAKDLMGNSPMIPNFEPFTLGLVAFLPNQFNYRLDTIRGGRPTNPFAAIKNSVVDIWFAFGDDLTSPQDFTVNEVLFSKDLFDFSNATKANLTIESPIFHRPVGIGQTVPFYHKVSINTSQYQPGEIIYMRVLVKDADHSEATEIPEDSSPIGLMSYFSFVIV